MKTFGRRLQLQLVDLHALLEKVVTNKDFETLGHFQLRWHLYFRYQGRLNEFRTEISKTWDKLMSSLQVHNFFQCVVIFQVSVWCKETDNS